MLHKAFSSTLPILKNRSRLLTSKLHYFNYIDTLFQFRSMESYVDGPAPIHLDVNPMKAIPREAYYNIYHPLPPNLSILYSTKQYRKYD